MFSKVYTIYFNFVFVMKKFFISIFAIFYLAASCGFAMNIHFCMDKFSSIDLWNHHSTKCEKCGTQSRKGCCDSKLTVVKITASQQVPSAAVNIVSPLTAIINYPAYISLLFASNHFRVAVTDSSPPPVSGTSVCILNSVFRI